MMRARRVRRKYRKLAKGGYCFCMRRQPRTHMGCPCARGSALMRENIRYELKG